MCKPNLQIDQQKEIHVQLDKNVGLTSDQMRYQKEFANDWRIPLLQDSDDLRMKMKMTK